MKGRLPAKAAALVRDWCLEHQPELLRNWGNARALKPLESASDTAHAVPTDSGTFFHTRILSFPFQIR